MRFSAIVITLLGAVVCATASILSARQDNYPNCALPCVQNPDLGGCVMTDTHCLCTSASFVNSTTTCIDKACSGQDLDDALSFSRGLCAKVGVTLTSSISSASETGSSTSSSTSTSSTSSAASSPSPSTAAASSHGANTLFGLFAAGLAVFAL